MAVAAVRLVKQIRGSLRLAFAWGLCARRLSSSTRVVSFGAGSSGALGCGGGLLAEDAQEPQEVAGLPGDLVAVSAGHYHSMAVTGSGEVWSWGRNTEAQLGRGHDLVDRSSQDWSLPAKVAGLEEINVKVVAGSGVVSMAVAQDGSVWAWGRSKRGQLGLGWGVTEALVPTQIQAFKGEHVVQVALGWGHALACTSQGKLYSWGYSADGRLGIPSLSSIAEAKSQEEVEMERLAALVWEPCLVQQLSLRNVVQVAAGLDHSLVLAENGEMFAFGDNSLNQLGTTASETVVRSLASAFSGKPVVSVGAGLGHSLAVVSKSASPRKNGDSGAAFSWGWNLTQQLGRGECGNVAVPGEIEELRQEEVVALTGGRAHSMAVTASGSLWVWGSGRNGRLGLGGSHDMAVPSLVEDLQGTVVLQAACGFDHSLLLLEN